MSQLIAVLTAVIAVALPDRLQRHQPVLSIRIERSTPYHPGDSVRTFVRVSTGVYLTILRVDTEGRIRVLYPTLPDAGGFVGAETARTLPTTRLSPFRSGPRPGLGYVAAFVSEQPFDYRSIVRDGRWDHSPTARGRIVGDPVAGLLEFMAPLAQTVVYDVDSYRVGGDYTYPRFACTGCHAATTGWDPYAAAGRCPEVTLESAVTRYPYQAGGPNRVVASPVRPVPHLVFHRRTGDAARPVAPVSGLRAILEPWPQERRPIWGEQSPASTGRPQLLRRRERSPSSPETRRGPGSYH